MVLTTLCFPVRGQPVAELLLGMKKRGVGAGKFNGFGGKIEAGESVETAVLRELHEESGLSALPHQLTRAAELTFYTGPTLDTITHVFLLDGWAGQPVETAEMRPHWFAIDAIPFDQMWADDRYWLPRVLAGERIRGTFTFSPNEQELLVASVQPLDD